MPDSSPETARDGTRAPVAQDRDDWQAPFATLRDDIDRMFAAFDPFTMPAPWGRNAALRAMAGWRTLGMPACELLETDAGFELRAEVPGYRPEDLDLRLSDGMLVLKGSRAAQTESEDEGMHWSERSQGSFRRAFRLPAGADPGRATAEIRAGVLHVSMPRRAGAEPDEGAIRINAA